MFCLQERLLLTITELLAALPARAAIDLLFCVVVVLTIVKL